MVRNTNIRDKLNQELSVEYMNARLVELDSLRGVAAFAVVLYHYFTRYDRHFDLSFAPPAWFELGALGVPLFFMISGFVIFWTIGASKTWYQFPISRFSRLYPSYWACIFLTFSITSILNVESTLPLTTTVYDAVVNLTMLQEFLGVPHVDGVYWTLTVELLFYFIVYLLWVARGLQYLNIAISTLIFFGFYWHGVHEDSDFFHYLGKIFIVEYIPFFALGIFFYKAWRREHTRADWFVFILSHFYIAYMNLGKVNEYAVIAIFSMVFLLIIKNKLSFLAVNPLLFLGAISYPLYLIHQHVGFSIIKSLTDAGLNELAAIAAAVVASIMLAYLIHIFIEAPGKSILKKWLESMFRGFG